ncbi:MAG: substrate-binding domain-containing protein [Clostridia bacterium]|nr:substrate-binding domain-containing protein [Clostridia bacterium]
MKKVLAIVLSFAMILSTTVIFAEEPKNEETPPKYYSFEESTFVKIKIPIPESIAKNDYWRAVARYKDSGKAITLSEYYDGYIHATVPLELAEKELDVFIADSIPFTDYDETVMEFFDMSWLSRTGVILGNEKGEAKPFDNVTRAEAIAMIMRFMGLDNIHFESSEEIFEDVSRNDWFYNSVMQAQHCGIVRGDSDVTFSPLRNVTREEVTTMVAGALKYAGLTCVKRGVGNIADKDKISDWAKDSYEYIRGNYIYDYSADTDNIDWDNPEQFLYPGQNATREDVAYMLNSLIGDCQLYASDLAVKYGFDKAMPIMDGSTSTYPFTQNVYSSLFYNGMAHPQYPEKHSKSHVSYQRLINGEVDMIFASVYPASDILELAKEKGVELELIPIAYDAMIFFTNKDNPATGLTTEQISNIYVNDAYDNWSELGGGDALLYPYCRNNDSGSHAQMERHFLNGNEIHPEVQKETSFTMSNILTDVMDAKTESPTGYALGYSIYYYYHNMDMFYDVHNNLKLLAIDGIMPTDETIANGTYPLSNNTYVVLRKDSPKDSPERKMAEFMLTEEGQQCVESSGFGRLLKPNEFTEDK